MLHLKSSWEKLYNFKFGIRVTMRIQIKAPVAGWGEGRSQGHESERRSFSHRAIHNPLAPVDLTFPPLLRCFLGDQHVLGADAEGQEWVERRNVLAHVLGLHFRTYCFLMRGRN